MESSRPRPKPVAWAILVALVLVLALSIRACGGGNPYGEQALAVARGSAELGQNVAGLRARIESVDRLELFRDLRAWQRAAGEQLERAQELEPPSEQRLGHGYLLAALGLRADALKRYEPAIQNALSDRDLQVAVSQLAGVMRDLALGDRAYDLFRGAWAGNSDPPEARWVADEEDATIEGVRAFAGELRDQPALEETYNLAVTSLTVAPRPAGREGDVDVLPFTRSLQITAIVENTGNQPVPAAPVAAILTSETDPRPQSVEGRVDALRPGEKKSVTLAGLAPSAGGPVNLLRVTVGPVGGERNLLDNTFEYKFSMRRP